MVKPHRPMCPVGDMVTEYSGDIGNTVAVGELLLNDCFPEMRPPVWVGLGRLT